MEEKDLLENMARVVSEIQMINTWIEDAKDKPDCKNPIPEVQTHAEAPRRSSHTAGESIRGLRKGGSPCTSL